MTNRILAAARTLSMDAIGIAGLGAITYGAWLINQPAGFIVGGVLAAACALLVERRAK
jgi:hypothetical protein